ncbi:uncharacterized protein LOC127094053 [Lathyrus oleraceus]|uniref:uncharacterized protein LOC127094053 n=1 Tax=Pisum sativum TaxID=3888 RepID=UPI0021D03ABB|nr:uncharacterized protein LOC127094053 [Pisum sativum]
MSQHPSSSGSKPSQHAKTSSMKFVDEDIMDVTPLCMIPVDTTGTSSNAGDKQGNTSGNSSLPKDMYYTDRAIRRLVTRILSEGHKVEGVSTPLSRREPSPEREPHADKDDDSSRSEKEVAAEGLCSLGKTLPSKKQNVSQENIIDLEEESTEGEDDPLVHLVKPSIAEKLRTKKGKSMAKTRAARVKKTAGVGPSKPWSKVEVGKRKERRISDSEEDVKDDVPDISPAKRQARRVAIERELGQEAVEVKEVIDLIKNAGLIKTVVTLPQCYEGLVKEFIVNIPKDIHDKNSRESCKSSHMLFDKKYFPDLALHNIPHVNKSDLDVGGTMIDVSLMYRRMRNHHLIHMVVGEESEESNVENQDVDKDVQDIVSDMLSES